VNRRGTNSERGIYGREREISGLTDIIRDTEESRGSLLFLKGEAGIGKTTLLRMAEEIAEEKGFLIMHGWCLPDSLEPLFPIREALISGGLEELYTGEDNPRIEGLYLINLGGVPMAKAERKEFDIDSDILASMISAVGEFLKDSMTMMDLKQGTGECRSMSYGDYRIVIEASGEMSIAALIKGRENEFLLADLSKLLEKVHTAMKSQEEWDGNREGMKGINGILREFLVSGHYDGRMYGAEDPRLRRSHRFENILMGIRRCSLKKPVLMVLDDLQWADPSSLSLVHYLARNLEGMRVTIIGAYRPEEAKERKHPLLETVRLMNREGLLKEFLLERLGIDESLSLIKDIVRGMNEEDMTKLLKIIYTSTDGNPFFVLETLKMMMEGGEIEKEGEEWRLKNGENSMEIPPRVYDVMIRKLDRLGGEERTLLEMASVLGLEFKLEELACLKHAELIDMAGTVIDIERNHGLITRKRDAYRFHHSMMREILYGEIPAVIKKAYHLRAAECLIKTGSDGEIGLQFYLAGDSRGVVHLLRAGEEAESTYSNLEAIRDYEMAYGICLSQDKKTDIMEKLGGLYSLAGSNERALQIYGEAFQRKKGDENRVGDAIALTTKISGVLDKLGRYDEAMKWIDKGEELAKRATGDVTRELGNLLLARGNITMRKGDLKGAEKLFGEGLKIFTENSHYRDIPSAYLALGLTTKALGNYDRALDYMEKSADSSANEGDLVTMARTYNSIGSLYGEMGDEEKALDYYRKALSTSDRVGDMWNISGAYNNIGTTFATSGNTEKAVRYYEKALKIAKKIGELRGAALLYNNLGGLQYDMGFLQKAIANYAEAMKISESIGAKWEEILTLNNLGEAYRTLGRTEEAEKLHIKGLRAAERMGEKMLAVFHRCGLAEVYTEKGLKEGRCELMKKGKKEAMEALRLAEEIDIKDAVSLSHRILGEFYLLKIEKGERERGEKHLRRSLEIYRATARKTDIAITLYLLSLMSGDEKGGMMRKEAEKVMGEENWERWLTILKRRWNNAGIGQ